MGALGVGVTHTFAPLGGASAGNAGPAIALSARRCAAWLRQFAPSLLVPNDAVVHAWSVDARDLMARSLNAAGLDWPIVCTPVRGPRGPGDLACPVNAVPAPLARVWAVREAPAPGFAPPPCPDPAQRRGPARTAARSELGLADGELLVMLLADPPDAGQARLFVTSVGIMHLANLPAHALIHASATDRYRAVRHTASFDYPWDVLITDQPLATLLPAADIALWHAPHEPDSGGVLLAHAAASLGLPVIAARSEPALWLLDDPAQPALAQALLADAPTHPRWAAPLHALGRELGRELERARTSSSATPWSLAPALAAHARSLCEPSDHTEPFSAVMQSLWARASLAGPR
jgi:hypothetical protein